MSGITLLGPPAGGYPSAADLDGYVFRITVTGTASVTVSYGSAFPTLNGSGSRWA